MYYVIYIKLNKNTNVVISSDTIAKKTMNQINKTQNSKKN